MTPNPIDRAAFTAWLEGQEPDAVVGMAAQESECPLAVFLETMCGAVPLGVGAGALDVHLPHRGRIVYQTTAWQDGFMREVDHLGIAMQPRRVRQREALAILRAIPEDTAP